MNSNNHVADHSHIISHTPKKNILVLATMSELGDIIVAIDKEGIPKDKDMDTRRLRETYLQRHTVDGEFEFDTHSFGAWVIRKIKEHKPKVTTPVANFVVEM